MSVAKRPLPLSEVVDEGEYLRFRPADSLLKPSYWSDPWSSEPWKGYGHSEPSPEASAFATELKQFLSVPGKEGDPSCRKSRRTAIIHPVDEDKIRDKFLDFRLHLAYTIELVVKKELLAGERAEEGFLRYGEPEYLSLAKLLEYRIEDIAWLVPEDKHKSVYRKWFGKTERDIRVSREALYQMSRPFQTPDNPEYPKSLLRYWDLDAETRWAIFTAEDAKDLCRDWHAPYPRSEVFQDRTSPEELTLMAKRMVDVLKKSLKSWQLFWHDEQISKR